MIDRYVEHQPPTYWPQWMVQQIEQSDFVVVVVTETYNKRFKVQQEDPRVGRGVTWEGAVISGQIYRNFGSSSKFIPIVFSANDITHIPFPLSETSFHVVSGLQPNDLAGLLHQLNQVPVVTPAPLGTPATAVPNEITTALSLAQTDREASISKLRDLTQVTDPAVAGTAAFHLGELLFADDQLTASIQSFRVRMSRAPWNFGGGSVSIRLRSPDHCAPQVRQIRRTRVPARRAVSAGAGDRSHVGTACRPRPSRPRTSAAPSARRATA